MLLTHIGWSSCKYSETKRPQYAKSGKRIITDEWHWFRIMRYVDYQENSIHADGSSTE